jgi:glyceraldehyde 3-phosphate dehydrogenase
MAGDQKIRLLSQPVPAELPWKDLGVDIVLECTGRFRRRSELEAHLAAGASRVLLSAPARDDIDLTVVFGINHESFDPSKHRIVSNASCTTNCLAPMVHTLMRVAGVVSGQMTTVHAYTSTQRILDLPHNDYRRARAAGVSMIPTTTGATRALEKVMPVMKGRLHGLSVRVPTPCVSLTDLTVLPERRVTREEVNAAFQKAAHGPLEGVLGYSEEPLVSSDYRHDPHSCVLDAELTNVTGDLIQVVGWYDNEWGFSNRMIDMTRYMFSAS